MARLKAAPSLEFFSRALIGIPRLVADETANDNDKTFIVPANVQWVIQSIYVEYAAANSASDRQLEIQLLDQTGDVIGVIRAGKVQATNTTRKYMFAPGMTRLTSFYDTDYLPVPFPEDFILLEGWGIRFFDNNSQDAADDMDIQMLVREMDTVDPGAFGEVTARRDFGDTVPVEQLVISPTQPIIETKPVIPVEQLTITPTTPHMGEHRNVGTIDLTVTPTAPNMDLGITPASANLTITPVAATLVEDFPHAPGAEDLTITTFAPTIVEAWAFSPGAEQLSIELHTPFNT